MADNPGITSQLASCHLHKYIFHAMFKNLPFKSHAKIEFETFRNYAKFENIIFHTMLITSQNYYHANFSRLLNAKHGLECETKCNDSEPLRSSF